MKYTKRKLTKIVSEILTYYYSMDVSDVSIVLEDDANNHYITFISCYNVELVHQMQLFCEALDLGRNESLEEMYWNLTGLSDLDDEVELHLVSSLIDHATLETTNNSFTLKLIRKRNCKQA